MSLTAKLWDIWQVWIGNRLHNNNNNFNSIKTTTTTTTTNNYLSQNPERPFGASDIDFIVTVTWLPRGAVNKYWQVPPVGRFLSCKLLVSLLPSLKCPPQAEWERDEWFKIFINTQKLPFTTNLLKFTTNQSDNSLFRSVIY